MRIAFGIMGLLMILWIIPIVFITNEIKIIKNKLGKEYVLDKDTLIIVDYNLFKDVVILSNGKEVNSALVK